MDGFDDSGWVDALEWNSSFFYWHLSDRRIEGVLPRFFLAWFGSRAYR
jgi:hypothetical protein